MAAIAISFDNRPEFYTNLDYITGHVTLKLPRAEQIGSIVVKLEGECITALEVPRQEVTNVPRDNPVILPAPAGSIVTENHKVLYKIQQVFPDEYYASSSSPYGAFPLQAGEHDFPFKFKLPINNACSDPMAMSKIGGFAGAGGYGSSGGLFGIGGVRVMDGSKQLYMRHLTRTLPPSLTGYGRLAETRYYVKVTVQRPGFLKENWRVQSGFKFLPIEPPRANTSGQETFARRPFAFRPRSPHPEKKLGALFSRKEKSEKSNTPPTDSKDPDASAVTSAPSVEISARLPHPPVLTCNQPIPLRLIAKKLVDTTDPISLVSLQIDLIGTTEIRSRGLTDRKTNRWVVFSNPNLTIPLTAPVGKEMVIPDELWKKKPLPNTVAPSFSACNLTRTYELEINISLAWGKSKMGILSKEPFTQPQTIHLPLNFAKMEVFSGIKPPPGLVEASLSNRPGRATLSIPPRLPPRHSASAPSTPVHQLQPQNPFPTSQQPPQDQLYPPQLGAQGADPSAPPYDDAPPSYDEAVADNLAGPFDGTEPRPAYSGVTNENEPSQVPHEKS